MKENNLLKDVSLKLVEVAMGRRFADTVIKNTKLVNVVTREILENIDIAIYSGRIALVGDASHTIGEGTNIVDASGLYAVPGFMDGHMHIESSMMNVCEFAKAVVPCGTTTVFADPHEIANVFGTKGVKLMIEDSKKVPLRCQIAMPSCVPAVSFFEDSGATISSLDVKEFMEYDEVCGLGELMNFPGVLNGDENMHQEIYATLDSKKIITGHYSMPETGRGLNAYIASGVRCCHESTRKEDGLAKMRLGMYLQIREGSAWHDLKEVVKSITENKLDTRYATLISDDTHPDTLINEGHLDHIVRVAIGEGVDPITAIQMVTINVAQCFKKDDDLGIIAPGRLADILLISDLEKIDIKKVFIEGKIVAENKKPLFEFEKTNYKDWVKNSVKLVKPLTPEDFKIEAPKDKQGFVKTRVMEIIEVKVGTYAREIDLKIENGFINADLSQDVIKVAVIERHKMTGTMGKGFVKGFGLKEGAVASTVAHDAHNLLVVGLNDEDMALAANTLADVGGGMVAVKNGKVIALLELPIAGLMCDKDVEYVAKKVKDLDNAWKELGCLLHSPFMTMALISLAVLPELRLTNRGLIDTINYKFTELFV